CTPPAAARGYTQPPGGEFHGGPVSGLRGRLRRRLLPGFRRLAPVPALLVGTSNVRPFLLRILREQVRLSALRAGTRDRPVPRGATCSPWASRTSRRRDR